MEKHEEFLNRITHRVEDIVKDIVLTEGKITGKQFENIVYNELLSEGIMEDAITHSDGRFPDFIITEGNTQFAVEVKKTNSDKWTIPGGSIYESLRNRIENTFVLMGKLGGTPEARFRKYKECISDLTVTHSPRFQLNLDLPKGEDYLTKNEANDLMEITDEKELNRRIRELLRTDKSTWYTGETVVNFSELSAEEKLQFFIDGVVLFPEVTKKDYSNFAPWMIYKCLVWCSNVRDVFSAGGTVPYDCFIASGIMNRILERTDLIALRINKMSSEEIWKHWHYPEVNISLEDKIDVWIELIESYITVSKRQKDKNKQCFPALFRYKRETQYKSIIVQKFIEELRTRMDRERRRIDE